MGSISYPYDFSALVGTPENVAQLDANFDAVTAQVNGSLDSTNLANNAVTAAKSGLLMGQDEASGDLTCTNAFQNIPGVSVAITPAVSSLIKIDAVIVFEVLLEAQIEGGADSSIDFTGRIAIDGSTVRSADYNSFELIDTVTGTGGSGDIFWRANVVMPLHYAAPLSAAAHTITLGAAYTALGGVATAPVVKQSGTHLSYIVMQA